MAANNSNNKVIILRRVSAVLMFSIVLLVFLLFFYYKIIPANQQEMNQRGHRILTQLIANFQSRDHDFHEIIANANTYQDILQKNHPYDRLNSNIPYDTLYSGSLGDKTRFPDTSRFPLVKQDDGQWSILHTNSDTAKIQVYVSVTMKDFARPILSAKEDIFDGYLVLLNEPAAAAAGATTNDNRNLKVLYRSQTDDPSPVINADTLQTLYKNSDLSGNFTMSLAGDKYAIFYAPFEFHNRRLLMAGLLSKEVYEQKLRATPPWFLPLSLILICLILIALPFLKIFLLSPQESICTRDVLATAASFFIGNAALTVILFYCFLRFVTGGSLHSRLQHFSTELQANLEKEIRFANTELEALETSIDHLPVNDPLKKQLSNPNMALKVQTDSTSISIDSYADEYIQDNAVSRIFWIDTTGMTIAKWSPFDYATPFTDLGNYEFYRLLTEKPAWYDGIAGVDQPVFYTGKSNLTAEFQTVIARQSASIFPYFPWRMKGRQVKVKPADTASFIALAIILDETLRPVMPQGFGFSVIDHTGKVLIDGDYRRSLAENLFLESDENSDLLDAIRFKRSDISFPMELHGEPYMARVAPLAGQPLYLVTYYDQKILQTSTYRFFHFTIQTLVLLWLLILLCLVLTCYNRWKPDLLYFNADKTDWIRPTGTDEASKRGRKLSFIWYVVLTVSAVSFFAIDAYGFDDLNGMFYISLLLPFYTLAGSKWRCEGRPLPRLVFFSRGGIVLVNLIIFLLTSDAGWDTLSMLRPILFQLVTLLAFWRIRRLAGRIADRNPGNITNLCLSILLISVLPTLGILTHAFYAEKVQFKKEKLAHIATQFFARSNYLCTELLPTYKSDLRPLPAVTDELIFRTSIYLTDNDAIDQVPTFVPPPPPHGGATPDAVYRLLVDKVYGLSHVWDDPLTIGDTAADMSWYYGSGEPRQIVFYPHRRAGEPCSYIQMRSRLLKPQTDLAGLGLRVLVFLFLLMAALLTLGAYLIYGTIRRLFLLQVIEAEKFNTKEASERLLAYFKDKPVPASEIYLKGLVIPEKIDMVFFRNETSYPTWGQGARPTQAELILARMDYFKPIYAKIWADLEDDQQRYILFDFCNDRYTNYKNSTTLYKLINKGIVVVEDGMLDVFCCSFRQYVLLLQEGKTITALKEKFNVPGTWASIRLPVFAILMVMAVFLYLTTPAFGGLITSICLLLGGLTTIIGFWRTNAPKASDPAPPGSGA